LNCDYGPSDFDIRHRFVSSTVWDIPLGRGKRFLSSLNRLADLAAGGWSLSAITTFQTGPWGNIFGSNATGDSGLNAHRGDCDLIGHNSIYAPGDLRSNGMLWLNPANFGNPATGFFGNCGRGVRVYRPLYHHARATPTKQLFCVPVPGGRWRIDWPRTNRGR